MIRRHHAHRWLSLHLHLGLFLCLAACSTPRDHFESGEPVVLQDRRGLAVQGYDPVAYFAMNQAVEGSEDLTLVHDGATYRFASQANHDAFMVEPERFAPAYGGWCAWAMADDRGSLVGIDPESFLIEDGKLLLFYKTWLADTRAMWLRRDQAELRTRAGRNWERITNERR